MNALIPAVIALAAVLTIAPANAEEIAKTTTTETAVTTTTEAAPAAPENYTLENGTAVVVEDGKVFTVDATGAKTAATDGDHATKEGKVLKVKDGALVVEAATHTEHKTEEAPAAAE